MLGTMSCVDHSMAKVSHYSGAVSSSPDVDMRPVITAIRELSAAIAGKEAEERTIVVQAPAVSLPEITSKPEIVVHVQPTPFEIKLPVQDSLPPPVVNVAFPVKPIIFIGICNIISTAAMLVYLVSR